MANQPALRSDDRRHGEGPAFGIDPLDIAISESADGEPESLDAGLEDASAQNRLGLSSQEEGIRIGNSALLEKARDQFRAALNAAPSGTVAFARRVTINLAIALRSLGKAEEAVTMLEGLRDELARDEGWLIDAPRALATLGNAYVGQGRRSDAIHAFQEALTTLGRAPQGHVPLRARLHANILISLSSALIGEGRIAEAIEHTGKALRLLSPVEEPRAWGGARHVQGRAFHQQASLLADAQNWTAVYEQLEEARSAFAEAREVLRNADGGGWALASVDLAGTEKELGDLLATSRLEPDRQVSLDHLRRAISLYREAFPIQTRQALRDDIRLGLGEALEALVKRSPGPDEAWLVFSASSEVLDNNSIAEHPQYFALLKTAWQIIYNYINGLLRYSPLYLGALTRIPQLAAALADFIDSLGISEAEVAPVISEALKRRNSKSLTPSGTSDPASPPPLPEKAPGDAAREMTVPVQAELRLTWDKDRRPDENPAEFAWRAYQTEAKAGTLHRGVIAQDDKPLAVKLASWLRSHPMPEGIDIPTLPEWNTRQLPTLNSEPARDILRLYALARKRNRPFGPKAP